MAEEDCGLCMFPNLEGKSSNFSLFDQLSKMTSRRITGRLLLFLFSISEKLNIQNI